jgi:hypothetical protein
MISGLKSGGGAKMLEFITMLSVVAMIFCAATVFVALIAGGLLKASRAMKKKTAEEIS